MPAHEDIVVPHVDSKPHSDTHTDTKTHSDVATHHIDKVFGVPPGGGHTDSVGPGRHTDIKPQ
jgi:hypothetical protein